MDRQVRSRAYQTPNSTASSTAETTLLTRSGTPTPSVRPSVTSLPTTLVRTDVKTTVVLVGPEAQRLVDVVRERLTDGRAQDLDDPEVRGELGTSFSRWRAVGRAAARCDVVVHPA